MIVAASGIIGVLAYVIGLRFSSGAATVSGLVLPFVSIVVLTWMYRASSLGAARMRATAAEDRAAVQRFVQSLSVEEATSLGHAAINADMLITRPAQAGHTPELPYGYPEDVRGLFRSYVALSDMVGRLTIERGLDGHADPDTVLIGRYHGDRLMVDLRRHQLYGESVENERSDVRSVWHWILVRTIAIGDLRHDLRDALRRLGIDPPYDPYAPNDPPPLTSADHRERKQLP